MDFQKEKLEKHKAWKEEYSKLKEYDEKLREKEGIFKTGLEFKHLNRYHDILPNEMTLVSICNGKRYYNANLMKGENFFGIDQDYIACQAPLAQSLLDFWIMILEYGCQTILMLTKLEENGKSKCYRYWPAHKNILHLADNFDSISVENVEEENISSSETLPATTTTTTTTTATTATDTIRRRMKITRRIKRKRLINEDEGNFALEEKGKYVDHNESVELFVDLLLFQGWPDFGVPEVEKFIQFRNFALKYCRNRQSSSTITNNNNSKGNVGNIISDSEIVGSRSGPIVVHCSAGVGRSGTYLTIDIVLRYWEKLLLTNKRIDVKQTTTTTTTSKIADNDQKDHDSIISITKNDDSNNNNCRDNSMKSITMDDDIVFKTVKLLKEHRVGMVQNDSQYVFCYEVILKSLSKTSKTSTLLL